MAETETPAPERLPLTSTYACPTCVRHFTAFYVDYGSAPLSTPCINPACKGTAHALSAEQRPKFVHTPTHEWFRPEFVNVLANPLREQVLKGFLLLRARTQREPVYSGDTPAMFQAIVAKAVAQLPR